ncbi:MAG: DNA-binding response regulator [Blastocatellia bacterium AA13]|nr:MAG: DNA-binding response regulator [Blastocatellia bacterium AA13]
MATPIRTLIVDDEPLARRKIRNLLKGDVEFYVIGECGSAAEAVMSIIRERPDLIFLDIQMPDADGFAVLKQLGDKIPVVVFVTAHDQYAIRAFEVHALDYLLKPFDRNRFEAAAQAAKARLKKDDPGEVGRRTVALLEEIKATTSYLERILIKSNTRVLFIKTSDIDWIEAEGKYVRLHSTKESFLHREAIGTLESQLDPKKFIRVHRSAIVNLDRVKELEPWFHGEYRVVLDDGTRLSLSRTCRRKLTDLL